MTINEKRNLSKRLITEALAKYRALFNKSPSDSDLDLYADLLVDRFEYRQVTWALTQFIKKGSAFFPSCGEIFAILKPREPSKEDLAPIIVSEMIQALRNYGQYDEARMLESVSEDCKLCFLALGSTQDVRMSENYETTKAQLERLVKGVLASKDAARINSHLQRIGVDTSNVIKLSDKLPMKSLSFDSFSPKDHA